VHESDEPEPLAHLRHGHVLPRKDMTEIDLAASEIEMAINYSYNRKI